MPRFSICVSSYKDEDYLPSCIESVLAQPFEDFELIIVDDGSPDGTSGLLRGYAERDSRVIPIIKEVNEGVHLGRKSAIAKSAGDYVILLDSDDELGPDCLSKLDAAIRENACDILHFGIEVINAGVSDEEASAFESYINKPMESLYGSDICANAYAETYGYRQDWRITQRAFEGGYFRKVWSSMANDRLGRAQDGYEAFVALAKANSQVTRNDIVGVRYFLGRGLNSGSELSAEAFVKAARGFWDAVVHMEEFASSYEDASLAMSFAGGRSKMYELLFNDWLVRVADENKVEAAISVAEFAGGDAVACELMRLARDRAYALLIGDDESTLDDPLYAWYETANKLAGECGASSGRYLSFRDAAASHIADLKKKVGFSLGAHFDIRIFVSTHKDVDTFDSKILQPVQVGCANAAYRFPWALHDDEGQNISAQNPMYCELTTQYWAWKNVDAEYYGFCHYRRYFDFSPKRHEENPWGEIIDDYINAASQARYGLDDETMRKAIEGYDCITTEVKDLTEFPGENHTPLAQYEAAPLLHVADLRHVVAILSELHPDYAQDAEDFLNGNSSCFCNMFIMRKQHFFDYCEWLFPILERFVSETDFSLYSVEAVRTPGHLAERLLNIYLLHQSRVGKDWKTKQLQCVHFEHPERTRLELSAPYGDARGRSIVPVVFAADDGYVPMVTTTIRSMLDNASKDRFYDIVVLTSNISWENQQLMRESLVGGTDNVSLRFHDVSFVMCEYDLATNNAHIGIETYYRFIIQRVMPGYDKVLYLDSDLIVEGDVAELYDTELGMDLLGATIDVDYLGNLNMNDGERLEYTKDKLKMSNPYGYFQAGVLLLNLKAMREAYTTAQWLEFASVRDYIFDDQDVLNAHCEGRVTYLDQRWNVMHACCDRVSRVAPFAPADVYKTYMAARQEPYIRHYAGCDKPWNLASCDWAAHYWKYARETPFYESLLAKLCTPAKVEIDDRPAPALSENNPIRKVVDPLMPLGSHRREVAKAVGRRLRGRN